MGIISRLRDLNKAGDSLKSFETGRRKLAVAMYGSVSASLKEKMEVEKGKLLAAQMSNYLMGEDISSAYENMEPGMKLVVGTFIDKVPRYGIEYLKMNTKARRLVLWNLSILDTILMLEHYDQYVISEKAKRITAIRDNFPGEREHPFDGVGYLKEVNEYYQSVSNGYKS